MKVDIDMVPLVLGRAQRQSGSTMEEGQAIRARKQFGALFAYAEAAEAALRKVAEMPCRSPGAGFGYPFWRDCREREAKAMGGKVPPEEQRQSWCPRCVAAEALESLPE